MFIVEFTNFLNFYSQDVLIVAFIVAILSIIIDKFLTKQIKLYIKMLTPFILGIMVFFLYNVLAKGIVDFSINLFSAGLLSGSLSSVIYAFIYKLLEGKTNNLDFVVISIEKLLSGYVNKEFITDTAQKIVDKVKQEKDDKAVVEFIVELLKKNKQEGVKDIEIETLANLCLIQVKNLNLCKKKTV